MKFKSISKFIRMLFIFSTLSITSTASIIYLIENNYKIKQKLFNESKKDSALYSGTKLDKYWNKAIMEGGYILHFRHATRNKVKDVQIYDSLEKYIYEKGLSENKQTKSNFFLKRYLIKSGWKNSS